MQRAMVTATGAIVMAAFDRQYFHSAVEQFTGIDIAYKAYAELRTYGADVTFRF